MEQILSYRTLFFPALSPPLAVHFCQQLPAMSDILHAVPIKICTRGDPQLLSPLLKCAPTASLCSHPLLGLHRHSASTDECQWVPCFPHGGIQWHTFASYAHPYQTPFCQTAPLLPSVTWQQNVMGYWWEGSAPTPTPQISTSDVMGQDNKIGSITFRAAILKSNS